MKKIISYSIFGSRQQYCEQWVFNTYTRILFFNVLMNRLLFPQFTTHIETDTETFNDYEDFFNGLIEQYNTVVAINDQSENLCTSMLWRLQPIFDEDAEYVFARDADAITTYREAQAVKEFIESGLTLHGITDSPAHTVPLMGGMCGFKAENIRQYFKTWEHLLSMSNIKIGDRGTDQVFMTRLIYPRFKMFAHYLQGMKNTNGEEVVKRVIADFPLQGVNPALWESNLTCRHIGSPGVVEMETIRFFKRFAPDDFNFKSQEKYPKIFNWLA